MADLFLYGGASVAVGILGLIFGTVAWFLGHGLVGETLLVAGVVLIIAGIVIARYAGAKAPRAT